VKSISRALYVRSSAITHLSTRALVRHGVFVEVWYHRTSIAAALPVLPISETQPRCR
jgi:hypothetical protein